MRTVILLALCLSLAAASAFALTVDSADVTAGGRQGDAFRIRGRFAGASIANAETVVVAIDRAVLRLPASAFTRRRNVLTHRGGNGAGRLSLLRLDLRKGRFLVTARGWPIAALSSPFPLALGDDCRMLALQARGKRPATRRRGRVRLGVVTPRGGDACGRLPVPRTMPVSIPAGTATAVTFTVDVAPDPGIDLASLRIVRADGPGDPLCTLAPQAGPFPNRLACTATVGEPEPTVLRLALEGTVGGATAVSPGLTLPVVGPFTADVAATIAGASAQVEQAWREAEQRLGDSLAARLEAIRTILTVPGILAASLGPDGRDIVLRYVTGWMGLLVLNRPPPPDEATPPLGASSRARPAPRTPTPRGIFRSCDDGSGSGAMCCTPDRRSLLEGRNVLVWNPGFFEAGRDDAVVIASTLREHACLGFQVTTIAGPAANVDSVHEFPKYATLVISSHAGVDEQGRVHLATGENVNDPGNLVRHQADADRGLLGVAMFGEFSRSIRVAPKPAVFTVTEDYFTHKPVGGRFPENAIVYASACYSTAGAMPAVFTGAFGAGAYYGFDRSVSQRWTTEQVAPQLFDGLLRHLRTTKRAFDEVSPKVDPFPIAERDPVLDKVILFYYGALFQRFGRDDIAYVDAPKLSPESPRLTGGQQQTLTVEVDGKGTCELTHHWHNQAEHGHLDGGDDVEGTRTEMTYQAVARPEGGSDGVGAEVLPPDSEEPIGVACNDVTVVAACGDGVRQETEVCDREDATACPARCRPDCTCEPEPAAIVVEVEGLAPGVAWQIREPDRAEPRIACPPNCSYGNPGGPHGITQLRVFPVDDPRTGDPPYDVVAFTGCSGTTALPAPGASCFLAGDEPRVVVTLQYRPIIAVTFGGEAGQAPVVSGNPTQPLTGQATGFACGATQPRVQSCARHFPVGSGVALQTSSDDPPTAGFAIELVSWDGPCAGQGIGPGVNRCFFVMGSADTCITATFRKPPRFGGITATPYSGPTCPTGPAP